MDPEEGFGAVCGSMRRWLDDAFHKLFRPVGADDRFPSGIDNCWAVIPPSGLAVEHVFTPANTFI